eukprot:8856048-Pyramimonas_sp.AAC.1
MKSEAQIALVNAKRVIASYQGVVAQHQSMMMSVSLDEDWAWAKEDDSAHLKALTRAKERLDNEVQQHVV